MRIIQLEKTMEVVLENIKVDDMYFIKLTKYKTKNGSENYNFNFNSKRVKTITFEEIEKYLNDPDFALIRIEES